MSSYARIPIPSDIGVDISDNLARRVASKVSLGAGTQLLMTRSDYTDRRGSTLRRLDEIERYCRGAAARLTVTREQPYAANDRDLILWQINYVKCQLARGEHSEDVDIDVKNIESTFKYLALSMAPLAGQGLAKALQDKKNLKKGRDGADRDRYELAQIAQRDKWIRQQVVAQIENKGLTFNSAYKATRQDLPAQNRLLGLSPRYDIGTRQIENICKAAGIRSIKSRSKK